MLCKTCFGLDVKLKDMFVQGIESITSYDLDCSEKLGYNSEQEKEYILSVIKADFQEAGDEDVFRKIKADLKNKNISDEDIRKKMDELNEKAKSDFI